MNIEMSLKRKHGLLTEIIGSPGYLSPLDRIRTGKRERAAQFGIDIRNEESFEANQSFPRTKANNHPNKKFKSPDFKLNGTELNSISFLPTFKKQYKNKCDSSYNMANNDSHVMMNSGLFDKSWQLYNHFSLSSASEETIQFQQNFINKNPNKALITINGRDSTILTCNDIACDLFDYNEDKLIGMQLKDLLDKNSQYKHDILVESHLDDTGKIVLCSGKLFDAIDSKNIIIPISLYMQKLTKKSMEDPVCLCIIEPVQRITGYFKINVKGHIRYADDKFSNVFGYLDKQNVLIGKDINQLIPSLKLPICGLTKETKKQILTGRTISNVTIPITVRMITKQLFNDEEIVYNCSVSFYSNISGLLTVGVSDGHINSYNPTFTRILFGYNENELKDKPILDLIPNFYRNVDDKVSCRMSYEEDDDDDHDHSDLVSNEQDLSFNSKSIDSSNLSIRSENISATTHDESSSNDTNETERFCVKCGCELIDNKAKPNSSIFDNIVNLDTPKRKCTNFIETNDFKLQPPQTPTTTSTVTLKPQTPVALFKQQHQPQTPTSSPSFHSFNDSLSALSANFDDNDNDYMCANCLDCASNSEGSDVSLIAIDDELQPHSAKKSGYYRKRNTPVITLTRLMPEQHVAMSSTDGKTNTDVSKQQQVTSTPAQNEITSRKSDRDDGVFYGTARHTDGSYINIIYQRKLVEISHNNFLICIWIMKNPEMEKSIIDASVDQSMLKRSFATPGNNESFTHVNQYQQEYEDIGTLGRGASGFVQFARRKQNSFEVVTKYIRKKMIHKDSWINDERYGQIPLEISILCKLEHVNIIKVLDIFQDTDYIQMVTEKHGCGMDLFEFIDRQPRIDECLSSYIFRQLVSAVAYLHANNIVHRDIKDENIVINESFRIKLIDFGSAAYMASGKKFATFCGTLDYCSPEVLLGNKYNGPELDCWTMGIVLYTLVFSENPFFDADETIECMLKPPFKVSKELMKLLFSILCPNPELRATINDIESCDWVKQQIDINQYKWENVIKNTVFLGNNAGDCRGGDSESLVSEDSINNQIDVENIRVENHIELTKTDKHSKSF